MSFSDRLKAARQSKGIQQKQLSELSGVSLRTIQNWESGVRSPSNFARIEQIADVLGIRSSDLLDDNEAFVASIGEKYGARSIKGAQKILTHIDNEYTNGELDEDDIEQLMKGMQEIYWKVRAHNKEKYGHKNRNSERSKLD